jgi:putative ubiquitin-RnfH superfamily antitoxin RatB of RatAB toxin-antitoxin module
VSGKRNPGRIRVEVVYALRDRQSLTTVEMEEGGTVNEAIRCSGLLAAFPDIDLRRGKVGIFGRLVSLGTPVRDGDRVEIYRSLIAEPKQARRSRAQRAQQRPRHG